MNLVRLLIGPDVRVMTPQRRLRHDLLYAVASIPFALLLGLLLDDELTGYPLAFGGTWATLGVVVAVGRHLRSKRRSRL